MNNVTYPYSFNKPSACHPKTRAVDVVVIGAGHAGLAMSACLADLAIDHVVFERGEVAQRWKHERWDSLKLLTPNWMCELPGKHYEGDDPDGFMSKDQVANYIADYARHTAAPVMTETEVTMVTCQGDGYRVVTNQGEWWCRAVVNASGVYSVPNVPVIAAAMPDHLQQVSAGDYRNTDQLPEGGVLVVGASATGLQFADEIQRTGRQVTLAVGEHVRMPRSYRGADIYWWLDRSGLLHESYDEIDDIERARRVPSPQLVGRAGGNLDINSLVDEGVNIVGRLVGMAHHKLQFSGSLANHCKSADLKMNRMLRSFDEWADENGYQTPVEDIAPTTVPPAKLELDLRDGEIKTIVWATGFKPDNSWLKLPIYSCKGKVKHDGGVVCLPGVYTLGQTLLRSRKSSFIYGAQDDARYMASHIKTYFDCLARGERSLAG